MMVVRCPTNFGIECGVGDALIDDNDCSTDDCDYIHCIYFSESTKFEFWSMWRYWLSNHFYCSEIYIFLQGFIITQMLMYFCSKYLVIVSHLYVECCYREEIAGSINTTAKSV